MGKSIGIDFGNDVSIAAVQTAEGGVRVLQNSESQDYTPSVVSCYRNQIRVGQMALDQKPLAPQDTIESIKRLMGRGYRDEAVQRVKAKAAYAVMEPEDGTDDDVRVLMGGKQYSPIQISAMIFEKIKKDAEMCLGDAVEIAVITVPAYFTDKQKDATRKAGQLAGFKVRKILDEPIAISIAFGVDNLALEDSKNILVYDFGREGLDVSVITIVNGAFVQLNTEADMWLGGDDFDRKIVDHILQYVSSVYGIDGAASPQFMSKLKEKAKQAKRALSTITCTDITIVGMLRDDRGNLIDLEIEITRTQFEDLITPEVARSMEIVRTAITNAGEAMTPDRIEHVLLVGEASQVPLVQSSLARIFGREKMMFSADPTKCSVHGAAIVAAQRFDMAMCPHGHVNAGKNMWCGFPSCSEPLFADGYILRLPNTTGMHYGVPGPENEFHILIPKGSPFPASNVKRTLQSPAANLKRICLPIYAGFDPIASNNELQATVWFEIPDGLPVGTPVEVTFSLDEDGILNNVLAELKEGPDTKMETYLDRGRSLRSHIEGKLNDLKYRRDVAHQDLDSEADKQWEELYSQATKALSANDTGTAGRCAGKIEQLYQSRLARYR